MVPPAMTKGKLERASAQGPRGNLVAETDAQDRRLPDELRHFGHHAIQETRISRARREDDASRW